MCVIKTEQREEIRSLSCAAAEVFACFYLVSLIQSVPCVSMGHPQRGGYFHLGKEPDDEQTCSSDYFPCPEKPGVVLLKHDMEAFSVKGTAELTEGVPLFG